MIKIRRARSSEVGHAGSVVLEVVLTADGDDDLFLNYLTPMEAREYAAELRALADEIEVEARDRRPLRLVDDAPDEGDEGPEVTS